jgi:hypothetical protein
MEIRTPQANRITCTHTPPRHGLRVSTHLWIFDEEAPMSQPECATCGATETNHVHAAARGWRLVLSALHCSNCARRFPAWMRTQF